MSLHRPITVSAFPCQRPLSLPAQVNNEMLAAIAVAAGYHHCLYHHSAMLLGEMTGFVHSNSVFPLFFLDFSLPFLGLLLPFQCFSLTFHCPSLPFHRLSLTLHCSFHRLAGSSSGSLTADLSGRRLPTRSGLPTPQRCISSFLGFPMHFHCLPFTYRLSFHYLSTGFD